MTKILVGMSGGVDSSLSAALLKEQGHEVFGVHNLLWSCLENNNPDSCCNLQASIDAANVAKGLDIGFKIVDARDLFMELTVKPMVKSYEMGDTPNSCCLCNQTTKIFALQRAVENPQEWGLATGHYARVIEWDGVFYPARAKNLKKDQSYFLYRLSQDLLSKMMFPLGEFATKEEVRLQSDKRGIIVSQKPDSQDLCMLPKAGVTGFMKDFAGRIPKSGPILYKDQIIGLHDGSIVVKGQKRGFGNYNANGKTLYVKEYHSDTNTIIMAEMDEITSFTVTVKDPIWRPKFYDGQDVLVQTRYHAEPIKAKVFANGTLYHLNTPVVAVRGQSLVAYDTSNSICLGGGIIV